MVSGGPIGVRWIEQPILLTRKARAYVIIGADVLFIFIVTKTIQAWDFEVVNQNIRVLEILGNKANLIVKWPFETVAMGIQPK